MNIAFSQACENNKKPILKVLQEAFMNTKLVLELGSGTGQHSVFFAEHMSQLCWQTSDLPLHHYAINARKEQSNLTNVLAPITIDLQLSWQPSLEQSSLNNQLAPAIIDGIFTANTLHIVSWPLVKNFFKEAGKHIAEKGVLAIYGPFNYAGKFTSDSNAQFDLWLKNRDPSSGIRDFEEIHTLAEQAGFSLTADHTMPANNRLLVFSKE